MARSYRWHAIWGDGVVRPRSRAVVLAVAGMLVASCGGGTAATTTTTEAETTTTAAPTTTTTAATTTTTVAETTTTTDLGIPVFRAGRVEAGTYATDVFGVGFTLELGDGWSVPHSPSFWRLALSRGGLRLDIPYLEFFLTRPDTPVDEVAALIDQGNIDVLSTEPVTIAGFEGIRVTAYMERFGPIIVLMPPTGGDLAPANEPAMMRFDILDVDGTTLIIVVEALPDEYDAFIAELVDPALATLEFR